jgi:hypothetical protein
MKEKDLAFVGNLAKKMWGLLSFVCRDRERAFKVLLVFSYC